MMALSHALRAPSLRFVVLLVGCWTLARLLVLFAPKAATPIPLSIVSPMRTPMSVRPFDLPGRRDARALDRGVLAGRGKTVTLHFREELTHANRATVVDTEGGSATSLVRSSLVQAAVTSLTAIDGADAPGESGAASSLAERPSVRGAMLPLVLPVATARRATHRLTLKDNGPGDPVRLSPSQPEWRRPGDDSLSASAWAMWRPSEGPRIVGPGGATLGGSQAGIRVTQTIVANSVHAYARLTRPLGKLAGAEAAAGASWRPHAAVPIALTVEQRFALDRRGRTAMGVGVVGGGSRDGLPARFRLDAYGQAGVVGLRRHRAYADGAVALTRPVVDLGGVTMRGGAVAAGSAQPGAERIDVGPRLSVMVPGLGSATRVDADWRARIGGKAQPGSGLTLTLATDF